MSSARESRSLDTVLGEESKAKEELEELKAESKDDDDNGVPVAHVAAQNIVMRCKIS